MSTMRCQSVRSLAFLPAEWIPMLTDCTLELIPSASIGVASYGALGHVPPLTYNNLIFFSAL